MTYKNKEERRKNYLENKEKQLAQSSTWKKNNRDKARAGYTRWSKKYPDKVKARRAAYYIANAEKEKATAADFRKANPEKVKEDIAAWRKDNPEKWREHIHARRTMKTKAGGSFTPQEWFTLCFSVGFVCLCCRENKPLVADHVIPVKLGGSSFLYNIQPLCTSCNSKKGIKTKEYRTNLGEEINGVQQTGIY